MLNYAKKIQNLKIGWNERHLSEQEFQIQCELNDIEVTEIPMKIRGICWFVMDQHVITINSRLIGIDKLLTMWHEFGHFIMHCPNKTVGSYFWGDEKIYNGDRREENEADAFALCAIVPKIWVETRTLRELLEEEMIPEEILWKRKNVYERFKV